MMLLSILLHALLIGAIPDPAYSPGRSDLKIVDYEGLEAYLDQYKDQTLVINFWATWCAPCVKELPYFEQVTATYADEEVVVVLVSLDFSKQINTKLKPFLKKHNLQSKVVLLDDPDQNSWIDEVDPRWSGAIPVTLIRKGERQEFYEKSFQSFDELNTLIQSFLNS